MIVFGPFEFDPEAGMLYMESAETVLPPKGAGVLEMLLENRGRLVTKDELLETVWSDSHVTESALTVVISAIRRALGDDSRHPIYIQTLHRRGYRFIGSVQEASTDASRVEGTAVAPVAEAIPGAERDPSVLVLPFTNMSADPENEFFADGMTEEIINALNHIGALRVVARTSAFSFKGQAHDPKSVGESLNVSTVLSGSVRRAGDRLRITAQLTDVETGYQTWSERYDRTTADTFAIQDEITDAIVAALQLTLLDTTKGNLDGRRSIHPEAHELYLEGRFFWGHQRTQESIRNSIYCFERAITLDPSYALAYAGLADAYTLMRPFGSRSAEEVEGPAKAAVERALQLDDALEEAQFSAGLFHCVFRRRWTGCEPYFLRAVEINPRFALAQGYLGLVRTVRSGANDGAEPTARSLELDPLSPLLHALAGIGAYSRRRYAASARHYSRALDLDPNFPTALLSATAFWQVGDHERALEVAERGVSASGRAPLFVGVLGLIHGLAKRRDKADSLMRELRLRAEQGEYVAPCGPFLISLGLGDDEEVYETLLDCVEDRITPLSIAASAGPMAYDLRPKPGIADVMDRLYLPA